MSNETKGPQPPAEAQAVGEVVLHDGLLYGRLVSDLPVGSVLYTAPQPPAEAQAVGSVVWSAGIENTMIEVKWSGGIEPPVGTKLYAAPPPSAPVGVEGLAADLETIWNSVSDDTAWEFGWKEINAAYQRLKAALAQQPAAVDGVDWRAMYRHQTAMRYMDNNAQLTKERAYRMADNDVAALELQQGGRSDD